MVVLKYYKEAAPVAKPLQGATRAKALASEGVTSVKRRAAGESSERKNNACDEVARVSRTVARHEQRVGL